MREPAYRQPPPDGSGSGALPALTITEDGGLVVVRTDRVDYGLDDESDESDDYEYFYAFATYDVRVGARSFRARRYADEWRRVSIFPSDDGVWSEVPYGDPEFATAARYFLALDDVEEVTAFASEYLAVDPTRL